MGSILDVHRPIHCIAMVPTVALEGVWGTPVEVERRNRICVALWAYAYEIKSKSLVTDYVFDAVAFSIDLSLQTGHAVMDEWFKDNFVPDTGMWVHNHPELDKLEELYRRTNDIHGIRS